MKQLKKLVRCQKEILAAHNLNWKNWWLVEETDSYIKIMNRKTGKCRSLDLYCKGVRIE